MNEANEIHRDIYVGMVAEELAQSGYYGVDVTCYGFVADGDLKFFRQEEECALAYLRALALGANVSRLLSRHQHAESGASRAELEHNLRAEMRRTLVSEPPLFQRCTVDLAPLASYAQTLAKPLTTAQSFALCGLITLPCFQFAAQAGQAAQAQLQEFTWPQTKRRFFGFYEKQGGSWQPVLNGALATILGKWLEAAASVPVSPILPLFSDSTRPVYQLRGDFAKALAETMDRDYLAMLEALYDQQQ